MLVLFFLTFIKRIVSLFPDIAALFLRQHPSRYVVMAADGLWELSDGVEPAHETSILCTASADDSIEFMYVAYWTDMSSP